MPSPADPPLIAVRDLRVGLTIGARTVAALDGVSFEVRRSETLGIVGESGSGKSLTAAAIMGMLPRRIASILDGEVLLDGVDILGLPDSAMRKLRGRRIGMIMQDPHTSLNPVISTGEQVAEVLRMRPAETGQPRLFDRVAAAFRSVRIAAPEHRIRDYPHEMSGGMKQRVVGAIALSGEPDLIIADEPTTALDATVQNQYLRLLKEIQDDRGLGIIFITHDFGIVAKICDRVAVMYGGRVVEYGDVRAVFRRPSHPYTRALLDSVPDMKRKVTRLNTIEGQPPSLFDLAEGCRFSARCPVRCDKSYLRPPMVRAEGASIDPGHKAACWRLEEGGT